MRYQTSRIGLFLAGALALAGAPGCQGGDPPPPPEPPPETRTATQDLTCGASLVPVMTGASTPSGTVTRSGILSSSYEAWRAFDTVDSGASMWLSEVGQTPAWIAYEWPDAPRTVTHYAIKFVNGDLASRAPKNWTMEGWNGTAWVVLDTRTNEVNWGTVERRQYPVASPGAYRKYRLQFTDDNDARTGIETISIGRVEFLNCSCVITNEVPVMTSPTAPSGTVTTSSAWGPEYEHWRAFDATDGSMWISFTGQAPVWLGYEWASGTRTISRYALKFANGADLNTRAPKNWTLEGWNGTAWVVVDRRNNEVNWGGAERREYPVAFPGAYGKYRLHVTEDNDPRTGIEAISLTRMELLSCQADLTPPASPTLAFSPASPSTLANPVLTGTTEGGATVRLFSGSTCAGGALHTLVASATGVIATTLNVTPNTTLTLSATATDAAGNVSACSPAVSYRHDNLPPAIPVLTGFSPASPGTSTQPVLSGTTEAGATVRVFAGSACAGSGTALAAVTAGANGVFTRSATVSANTTTNSAPRRPTPPATCPRARRPSATGMTTSRPPLRR
ncbi:hypothetical protein ACLESO_11915 [Pyxidicoccus sp. 3LG]